MPLDNEDDKGSDSDSPPCSPPDNDKRRRRPRWLLFILVATTVSLTAGTVVALIARGRKRLKSHRNEMKDDWSPDQPGPPRIPLSKVLRWKEKQWYDDDILAARGGDANAMIRLAKHCLYGAGTEADLRAAQSWLRAAKNHGINCSIDELVA
jgi:TPR repeat protein